MRRKKNETNIETRYNNLKLLDVTSENIPFPILRLLISKIILFQDQLLNLAENLCSCHYSDFIPESHESHISIMNLNCRRLSSKFGMLAENSLDLHYKFDIITKHGLDQVLIYPFSNLMVLTCII